MKYTLITGASGGIGEAIAVRLAERKQNLILIARNEAKLKMLADSLTKQYQITVQCIVADLSEPQAPQMIFDQTQKHELEVEMLINNAGIGSGGEFAELSLQSELDLIQLNNASLVAMTHLFLQRMKKSRSGTIVNVASMAAFIPASYMATYAASKVFVRFFSEAIIEECKPYNVHVLLFSPGLTKTNFNKAAGIDNEKGKGLNTEYGRFTQTPQQVANEVMMALDKKQHTRISGTINNLSVKMMSLIPNRMIAGYMASAYRKNLQK